MARIVVLDSGPLGLACDRPDKPEVIKISRWLAMVQAGSFVFIPEIADYEVRVYPETLFPPRRGQKQYL